MARAAYPGDDELENNASACANRSKGRVATIFPPVLQSQPTSPDSEGFEGPPLYKNIVHVHQKVSEKQQKLDAAWIDRDKEEASINVMNRQNTERWNRRNLSSVWERESEEEGEREEKPGAKCVPDRASLKVLLKRKLNEYKRQWKDGISVERKWTVIEACIRMICSSLIWCLIMGTWLEQKTGKWGVTEVAMSMAVSGSVFQLFGGQALMIAGPDAPSLIFIVAVSTSARHLGLNAVSWMGWIGIWASIFLLLLAISNASKFMRHVTIFSWDVICIFIRLTFLSAAVEQLIRLFAGHGVPLDSALLSLWLATIVFFLAASLCNVKRWLAFSRYAASDYAMLIVLSITTAISHLPKLSQPTITQVSLPEYMYHSDQTTRIEHITLRLLPFWAILLAVIPGIMLAGLIFVYHNAVTALLQDEAGSDLLYKDSQRWDLCILALLALLCSLFGLPIPCGMLHQTHCHVRALTVKFHEYSDMEEQRGQATRVTVQRISSIGAALFSATFLLPPMKWVIRKIPAAVLIGLLLQLAFLNWRSWNLLNLITALLMKNRLKSQERIPTSSICVYSAVQISCIVVVTGVSKTPAAVLFPLIIFVTLWIRHYALRGLFQRHDYARLDVKLHKNYSEMSSSDHSSSVLSPDARSFAHQPWPRFAVTETLKPVVATASPVGEVQIEHSPNVQTTRPVVPADSSESPIPRMVSPSLLFVSSRRLKERSRRRHKRKQMAFTEDPETQTDEQPSELRELESDGQLVPPLIRALMEEQQQNAYDQEEGINLSKRVSPSLSPQFFKKSKQKAEGESPLEVHSNLLYEPPKNKAGRKQMEEEDAECSCKKKRREEASSSAMNENFEMRSSSNNNNNRKSEIVIVCEESGGGIGRCIRSPPTFVRTQSLKKKKVHLSFSTQRSRSSLLVRAHHPKPLLVYPLLRRSSTSKWPSASFQNPGSMEHQQQQQRHSTAIDML